MITAAAARISPAPGPPAAARPSPVTFRALKLSAMTTNIQAAMTLTNGASKRALTNASMPTLSAIAPAAPNMIALRASLRGRWGTGERVDDRVVSAEQQINKKDLQEDQKPSGAVDQRQPSSGSNLTVGARA
jgi:hypothetical protein